MTDPVSQPDREPTDAELDYGNACEERDRALAALAAVEAERDALLSKIVRLHDLFESSAAFCLIGSPNEWMQGEARAYSRCAADLRLLLSKNPLPTKGEKT